MKYLIDKEKLEREINEWRKDFENKKNDLPVPRGASILQSIADSLVPYEEKKEIPSILYGNGCGGTKDNRCMKCNGDKEKSEYNTPCGRGCTNHKYHCAKCNTAVSYSPANFSSRPQDIPNLCNNCNFTGKEPRKEQDTRTHAWETPVSKQTYYSQDEVRKMLEDLKDSTIKHDSTDSASEEYYINGYNASTNEMNANIDKKIAEL